MNLLSASIESVAGSVTETDFASILSDRLNGLDRTALPHSREPVLAILRDFLQKQHNNLRERFLTSFNGLAYASERTALVDAVMIELYRLASNVIYPAPSPDKSNSLAIIAIGGYGRAELAPFSDIDLLFLTECEKDPQSGRDSQIIEYLLYSLWDLGFHVGQACRSIPDCTNCAREDPVTMTGLLDRRFLAGNPDLMGQLTRALDGLLSGAGFINAKLEERERRHTHFGASRYLLEPNIKEGKGGLRDLQTLSWTARAAYDAGPKECVALGVFSKADLNRLDRARAFLMRTRAALHLVSTRAEERLTFSHQVELARLLRYASRASAAPVERFMRHFFITAREVGMLSHILFASLEARHLSPARRALSFSLFRKTVDDLPIDANRLSLTTELVAENPFSLIKLFASACIHDLALHPQAIRIISRNLYRIDDEFRQAPQPNTLFLRILMESDKPGETLRKMSESGVLGRFLPEFGRIIGHMQFDMYHVYTVDEHSLFALDILRSIEIGALVEEVPIASEVIHQVSSRRVLYLAVLLHDIAKGRGGDHSVLGAGIARAICTRMGLGEAETETVAWLVLRHLLMSHTAFKRDIDDPKTIDDFVSIVQSPENLRLLLILTVADIRAVGPLSWTQWKARLLRRLYHNANNVMTGGMTARGLVNHQAQKGRETLERALLAHGWEEASVALFLSDLATDYLASVEMPLQLRHAELWRKAIATNSPLLVDFREQDEPETLEVTIITLDQPELMGRLAGAIALAGATILTARVHTLARNFAVDTFLIATRNRDPVFRPAKRAKLASLIRQVVDDDLDLERYINEIRGQDAHSVPSILIPPRVILDNEASDTETVVEVTARDAPGLIWYLTNCIYSFNLRISKAKIATYGSRASDVFFLRNQFGLKIQQPRLLKRLRDSLIAEATNAAAPGKPDP